MDSLEIITFRFNTVLLWWSLTFEQFF